MAKLGTTKIRISYDVEITFQEVSKGRGQNMRVTYDTPWGKWNQTLIPVKSKLATALQNHSKDNGLSSQYNIEIERNSGIQEVINDLFEVEEVSMLFTLRGIREKHHMIVLESTYWITDPLLAEAHQVILEDFEAKQISSFDIRDFKKD